MEGREPESLVSKRLIPFRRVRPAKPDFKAEGCSPLFGEGERTMSVIMDRPVSREETMRWLTVGYPATNFTRVILPAIEVSGRWYTSETALRRWWAEIQTSSDGPDLDEQERPDPATAPSTPPSQIHSHPA